MCCWFLFVTTPFPTMSMLCFCFVLEIFATFLPRVPAVSLYPDSNRTCSVFATIFDLLTLPTVNSVGGLPLHPPETPDGGPELPRSRTEVVFHGLSELLPHQSFCLSNHPSRMLLGLPVPISCFQSQAKKTQ
ncbi:hypothetical protein AMECASPLE_004466 [Ameca splendens]|uniref:Secreted protein n=1 Tax=Ameca splendens TaxID=208324 RepID=A0ABV0Y9Z1_9TELE